MTTNDAASLGPMQRFLSLRGVGDAQPVANSGPSTLFSARSQLKQDDQYMLAVLSSPSVYERALTAALNFRGLEQVLTDCVPTFGVAAASQSPPGEVHLHPEFCAALLHPVVGNSESHAFFERTVPVQSIRSSAQPRSSRFLQKRKPKVHVVVDDAPPTESRRQRADTLRQTGRTGAPSANILQRSARTWDSHMESVAAQAGLKLDELRTSTREAQEFMETNAFVADATENEFIEQTRLQNVAAQREAARAQRKRGRDDPS